ncbi:MAG TPA: gliding motility-associated C-terminal domain-containing protein [Chitinophagales bacterium]|nr:gliding motility-associated C-terminal domain-containing protein [Chitinophagales bacterium]
MIKVYPAYNRIFAPKAAWLFILLMVIGAVTHAQTIPAFEVEPNNTAASSTAIPTNPAKIRGYIYNNGDVDYYSFSATAGDKVYAATQTAFSANANTDSHLELFASDGTTSIELDDNDGSFGASASTIAGATIPATGTYYLRVRHNSATNQLRPYDLYLHVKSGSPVAETEPNDLPATATPIAAGNWMAGSRSTTTDVDYFSVTLNAGETVFISLDLDPERNNVTWNGRLGISPFGNASAPLIIPANDANATSPNSEAIFMTVKDAGTYYVYVDAASAITGESYTFSIARFAATTGYVNYPSVAVPVTIPTGPGIVTSTITITDSTVIKDLAVRINIEHTFMQDLDATLTAPDGSVMHLFSDIGGGTSGGLQTTMDLFFDDFNGIPPSGFTTSKGMGWQPELLTALDLFKGANTAGTWTLTLYDDATGDGGTLNGWSLDVLKDDTKDLLQTYIKISSENFESSDGGYTHSGTQDEWAWGTPNQPAAAGVAAFTNAHSGVNCWKTDLTGTYNVSSYQTLESPSQDFTTVTTDMYVSLALKYAVESASFDTLYVFVEEVGGTGLVQQIFTWYGATPNQNIGSPTVNTGFASAWKTIYANISAFAGKVCRLKVRLITDDSVNQPGVAIDDVQFFMACPTITLSPGNLPDGTAGTAYTQTITQTGGAGAITYAITAGALPNGLTMDNAGAITGTPTATGVFNFTVEATDANGCTGDQAYSVTINCPTPTTALTVTPNPVCNYGTPVTLGGGTPAGGTYSGTGVSAGTFDPSAGTQTITYTVTDIYGCVSSDDDVLTVNTPPTVNLGGPYTQCGGSVTLDAGNAGSTYAWSDGTTTTQTLTATASNTYSVTVTDANTCSASAQTTVTINSVPTVSITGTTELCSGATGNLTATTAATNFVWSTGETTATIAISTPGVYRVTVTDGNGCTATNGTIVAALGNFTVTNSLQAGDFQLAGQRLFRDAESNGCDTKVCPGYSGSSGYFFDAYNVINNSATAICATAAINAACGTDFFVSFYTGTFNPSDVCINYAGDIGSSINGDYDFNIPANSNVIVVVSGVNPSTACASYTLAVSGIDFIQITPAGPTNFCSGSSVDLTANGGSGYTWSTTETTATITVEQAGTYTVTGTDPNGCSATASQAVTVYATPVPTNVNGYTICEGNSIPSGQGLTATPAMVPLQQVITFSITNPAGDEGDVAPGVTIATINLPGLPAGSVVSDAVININGIELQGSSWADEVRLELSGNITNTGTAIASTQTNPNPFDGSFTIPSASIPLTPGTATLSYYEDFNDDGGGPDALFPATGTLTITYEAPGSLAWYDLNNAGTFLGNGSPFDPLSGAPATGTTTYYVQTTIGSCESARVPAELTVNPRPVVDLGGPYEQCGGNVVLDAGNPGSTYLWSTGATTKTIIVTTSNTYSVTVTGANGCTTADTTEVTINPLPIVDLGGPYTQCQGTVTLDAGNPGSTYLWSDNSTNQTLVVSASGDYEVTVTDINSCSASATTNVQIDLPPLNTTGYTICQGETVPTGDGFTASGCGDISTSFAGRTTLSDPTFNRSQSGTTYNASAIGTATHYNTHQFSVGTSGAYTFTLCGDFDTYLHIYRDSINTAFPATNFIVADDDDADATCASGSRVTVNLTAGVSYTFVTTGFSNSDVGTYTVTFTGAGSVYEGPLNPVLWFEVPVGGPLVGTGTPFNPVGTAALPNTNTAGTYTFYVACPNTPYCRTPVDFVINPTPTAINLGGPYTQCGGNVTLDAGAVTPGSTYSWSDGATTQTTVASTSGTYTVTVTNTFTCSAEGSADVYIQPVPVVNLGTDVEQCGGTVTLDAGTPGSTYLWSDNSTSQTLTVSTTGTYGVTVTDINSGCTASDDADVTIHTFPVVNLGPDQTQCGGSVTLDAGNAGATYLWSNGATTQTVSVSTSGIYRVTVTNATNCTATGSVNVTINTYPVLGADKADSVCSGTTVNLNTYYTNSGYATYVWDTPTPAAVGAGVYQLIVTNTGGCADTAVVTITNRVKPDLGPDISDSVCIGYTFDLWTLYPNSPAYTSYIWNTPTPQEVTAGTYTLIVTNASGCKDTVNATITTREQPVLGADAVDSVCVGYTLDLTTYFPDNGYASYTWNTATPDSVGAGVYTLVVSNASGCYDTAQVTITWRQQPVVTLVMDAAMCYTEPAFTLTGGLPAGGIYNVGDSLNVLTFNPTVYGVGTHLITYIYINPSGCVDSASINFTVNPQPQIDTVEAPDLCAGSAPMNLDSFFTPLGGVYSGFAVSQNYFYPSLAGAGTHLVTYNYTDANGCMDTLVYPIAVKNSVNVSLVSSELDYTICSGDYILFTASGAEFYEFFLNGVSQGAASTTDTFSTTGLASHDEVYVIGTNSCSADTSDVIITDVITLPTVDAGKDTTITLGETVMINTTATGTGLLLYQWTPDYFLNFTNVPNPTFSGPDTTTFTVKVTDTYGCWAQDSVTINVFVPDNILLPNIITANGDGKNDIWRLNPKINLDGSELIIFNRWGEMVYESENYTNDWDGTFRATGKKLPDDTYYYVLKVPAQNNHIYKGAINILNSDAK